MLHTSVSSLADTWSPVSLRLPKHQAAAASRRSAAPMCVTFQNLPLANLYIFKQPLNPFLAVQSNLKFAFYIISE